MVLLSSSICEFGKSMPKINLKNIDNNFSILMVLEETKEH